MDLSSLGAANQPALQVTLYAAYQLFVDGRLIGTAGNPQSGAFTMDAIRNWSLAPGAPQPATIALRITRRFASSVPVGDLPPLQILAGDETLLSDRRSALDIRRDSCSHRSPPSASASSASSDFS